MIQQVKSELLYVLKTAPEIIDDSLKLEELSDYSIRSASVYQDSDSLSIAVIIYSLSNMLSRYQTELPKWKDVYSNILQEMQKAKNNLEQDNIKNYRGCIKNILSAISKSDKDIKLYIDKVIEKAKIKKGTKIFEQGISLETAANLMGISVWEMMNYVGKTEIFDKEAIKTNTKDRINFAKELFDVK